MLDGKNIVVTGAASGIGAETARVLLERGANVIGLDINPAVDGGMNQHMLAAMHGLEP